MKRIIASALSVGVVLCLLFGSAHLAYADDARTCSHSATKAVVASYACVGANGRVNNVCTSCGNIVSSYSVAGIKSISLSKSSFVYNGKEQKPYVSVVDTDGKIVPSIFYSVTYSGDKRSVGKYSVNIVFSGNYSGTKKLSYAITPKVSIPSVMAVGQRKTLKPSGSKKSYKFSTSDKSIATVSSKGVITAKKTGSVTVKIKSNGTTVSKKISVKKPKLSLNKSSLSLAKGKTFLLEATTVPAKSKITWSSSKKSVASVDKNGKIKAVKTGTCNITARMRFNGKTYKKVCKITVTNPKLSAKKITLNSSKSKTLSLSGTKSKAKWSSTNPSVATVKNGVVTGVKAGTATIKAVVNSKTLICKITVKSTYASTDIADLGARFGVLPISTNGNVYVYNLSQLSTINKEWYDVYHDMLNDAGYAHTSGDLVGDDDIHWFANSSYRVKLVVNYKTNCVTVGYSKSS